MNDLNPVNILKKYPELVDLRKTVFSELSKKNATEAFGIYYPKTKEAKSASYWKQVHIAIDEMHANKQVTPLIELVTLVYDVKEERVRWAVRLLAPAVNNVTSNAKALKYVDSVLSTVTPTKNYEPHIVTIGLTDECDINVIVDSIVEANPNKLVETIRLKHGVFTIAIFPTKRNYKLEKAIKAIEERAEEEDIVILEGFYPREVDAYCALLRKHDFGTSVPLEIAPGYDPSSIDVFIPTDDAV